MKKLIIIFTLLSLAFSQYNSLRVFATGKGNEQSQKPVNWNDGQYSSLKISKVTIDPSQKPINWNDGQYSSLKVSKDVTPPKPEPPTPAKDCAKIYTECNYKGTVIELCNKVPKFDINTIHSIYVPKGGSVTLYGSDQYQGKSVVYRKSVPCIDKVTFAFLAQSENPTTLLQKSHLRK